MSRSRAFSSPLAAVVAAAAAWPGGAGADAPPPGTAAAAAAAPAAPPVITITTLDQLRDACEALTPPAKMTFGGATAAERTERARAHAVRHAAFAGSALAFRFVAREAKLLPYDAEAGALAVSARPALKGVAGALTLNLTDLDEVTFALGAPEADAVARAWASGAAWLHVLILPDDETLVGAACFSYPRSEAYRLQGLLLEAAVVRAADGAVLARARTPLYASWEAELGRRAGAGAGPRVSTAKVRVVEGAVAPGELMAFGDGLPARLLPCWRKVLEASPGLSGALVVSLAVDRKGRARDVKISIDMLHAKDATTCVLDQLAAGPVPRASTAEAVLALPIYFEP